jgi:adenylate cyclase
MTIAVSEQLRRLVPVRDRIAHLLRSAGFKALIGAHVIVAVIILVRGHGWLQPFELLIYDALRVAWSGHEINNRILLVSVNESDIRHLQDKWPLQDGYLADLLERIASWKPRAIAVDIYRDFPRPPGSEQLVKTLARYPNILWGFKLGDANDPGNPPPQQLRGTDRAVLADTLADPGRVVRRALLFADDGKEQYTGMGTALALGWLAGERIQLQPGTDDSLRLGKATIVPLDDTRGPYVRMDSRGYQMLMDYHGGAAPFLRKSVGDIMESEDAAALVRGRVVILGGSAESVPDAFSTPFSTGFNASEPIWGSILHAYVADQLIRAAIDGTPALFGFPRLVEDLWIWAWAIVGMALGLLVRYAIPALCVSTAGLLVMTGIVYGAFGAAVLLPALPAAIAWVSSAGMANRVMHAASNRSRALLRKSFEHYLPPAVIAQMLASETLPKLGGEQREISVVFTDVAGFTTLCETMAPEFLSTICNDYFDGVCGAIFEQGGMVNEFIGDAVLAFFGAPHAQPDHADRAVAAALGVDAFASRFSAEQKARGINFGHTRIGVHTGIAMVGNVGTRSRLKYSALGDMLNTGSRLEGLNKTIGTHICVSGDIVRKDQRHRFRQVGAFVVKGRHGATDVYEPVDPRHQHGDLVDRYEAAFRALEAGQAEAAERFAALHREYPEDACTAFHCQRAAAGESGTLIVMTEK